jgi:type II secretory ATPase GspE/PulE/Tfp pilus assembly ATPase PilB-like protein
MQHIDDHLMARLGFTWDDVESSRFYEAVGCPNCVGGYKGRVAIHETFYVTQEVRDIIMDSTDRVDVDLLRHVAIAHGMSTLRNSGLALVKSGVTTVDEVVGMTTQD